MASAGGGGGAKSPTTPADNAVNWGLEVDTILQDTWHSILNPAPSTAGAKDDFKALIEPRIANAIVHLQHIIAKDIPSNPSVEEKMYWRRLALRQEHLKEHLQGDQLDPVILTAYDVRNFLDDFKSRGGVIDYGRSVAGWAALMRVAYAMKDHGSSTPAATKLQYADAFSLLVLYTEFSRAKAEETLFRSTSGAGPTAGSEDSSCETYGRLTDQVIEWARHLLQLWGLQATEDGLTTRVAQVPRHVSTLPTVVPAPSDAESLSKENEAAWKSFVGQTGDGPVTSVLLLTAAINAWETLNPNGIASKSSLGGQLQIRLLDLCKETGSLKKDSADKVIPRVAASTRRGINFDGKTTLSDKDVQDNRADADAKWKALGIGF